MNHTRAVQVIDLDLLSLLRAGVATRGGGKAIARIGGGYGKIDGVVERD